MGMPVKEIAAVFCITDKAAAAKVRRGAAEQAAWERAHDDGVPPPDRPWYAEYPSQWGVYVLTGESALAALDVADPGLVLPASDLALLRARQQVTRLIANARANGEEPAWGLALTRSSLSSGEGPGADALRAAIDERTWAVCRLIVKLPTSPTT